MNRRIAVALSPAFVLSASITLLSAQSKTEPPVPTMPGRLVATDAGHRLHVWCTGEGSPTVILSNGGGTFSIDWAAIRPAVAAKTRVCSYDRAGYAWIDPGPAPRGVDTAVAELHQVLAGETCARRTSSSALRGVASSPGCLLTRIRAKWPGWCWLTRLHGSWPFLGEESVARRRARGREGEAGTGHDRAGLSVAGIL